MSADLVNGGGNVGDGILKTPLFTLYDSHLVIKNKDEMKIFHLDDISNVRFSKKRNFTINVVLLFVTLLIYCFVSDYLDKNFLYKLLVFVIALVTSIISLSIRNHTYILFINLNHFGFKELKLSKKESSYAEHFVSIFKTQYVKKKNQNDLDFVKFKHSS